MKQLVPFIRFSLSSRMTIVLLTEITISVLVCLGSLYLFLKIGHELINENLKLFDSRIIDFVYSFRSPEATTAMLYFTLLGSPAVMLILSIMTILYIGATRKKDAIIYVVILYSGVILNLILKYIYQRPRPDNLPLIHESSLSFPSGHAMNSFVFFAAFSYFIFRESKNKKIFIIILSVTMLISGLIGLSRIYLGVHFPTDVIGGYIAGFLWFVSAILFEKIIIVKRLYKGTRK